MTPIPALTWLLYIVLGSAGLLLCCLLCGNACRDPRRAPLWFVVVMGMTYIVRPPMSYIFGGGYDYALTYGISLDRLELLGLLVGVAFFAFGIGYWWKSPTGSTRSWLPSERNRFLQLFAISLIILGYVAMSLRSGTGHVDTLSGGSINPEGNSYLQLGVLLVPAGSLLLYASSGWLLAGLIPAIPYAVDAVSSAYNRYTFLIYFLSIGALFVIRHPSGLSRLSRFGISLGVAATFGIFIFVGANRAQFVQTGSFADATDVLRTGELDRYIGDFAGFEGTMYTINDDQLTPTYGARIVYHLFVLPIPRSLWPDKPLPPEFTWHYVVTGQVPLGYRGQEFMLLNNSQVRGSIGYAIEDWGFIGVPAMFFLLGAFYGWLERFMRQHSRNPAAAAAYPLALALLIYVGRQGMADNLARFAIYFFVPYLAGAVLSHFITKKTQPFPAIAVRARPTVRSVTHSAE